MPKQSKQNQRVLVLLSVLIFISWLLRFLTVNFDVENGLYMASVIYRPALYITLYIFWVISLMYRLVQRKLRRYLLIVGGLMIMWMTFRTIRFAVPEDIACYRYLWYGYYIASLVIPTILFLASMHLNTSDEFVLDARWKLVFVPTFLFLGLVLSNDLHQWVFYFTDGIEYCDIYKEQPLYFCVHAWRYLVSLASFFIMVKKCRITGRRKMVKTPIMFALLLFCYDILYVTFPKPLSRFFGDCTLVECLFLMLIIESCIRCGLVRSNMLYGSIIKTTALPIKIVDDENRVLYKTENYEDNPDTMLRTSQAGIKRGTVQWQEDLTQLNELTEQLEDNNRELVELHAMLQEEFERREKAARIAEKNRLYDRLQEQTAPQISKLSELIGSLERCEEDNRARELLKRVVVIGAYLKRKNNLVLVADENGYVPAEELERAFMESVNILNATGVECGLEFPFSGDIHSDMVVFYDCFEHVLEETFDRLTRLIVCFEQEADAVSMRLLSDACVSAENFDKDMDVSVFVDEDDICYIKIKRSVRICGKMEVEHVDI